MPYFLLLLLLQLVRSLRFVHLASSFDVIFYIHLSFVPCSHIFVHYTAAYEVPSDIIIADLVGLFFHDVKVSSVLKNQQRNLLHRVASVRAVNSNVAAPNSVSYHGWK